MVRPAGAQVLRYTIGVWQPGTVVTGVQTTPLVSLDVTVPSAGLLCGQPASAGPAGWPNPPVTNFDLSQPIVTANAWWVESAPSNTDPPMTTLCSYPIAVWANTLRTNPLLAAPGTYPTGVRATNSAVNSAWTGGLPSFLRPAVAPTAPPSAPGNFRIVKQ
jgi:hypothetical protein